MLEPQGGMQVGEIIEWAEYAEKAGFGYILRSDHLMPTGGLREEDSPSPECWVTLGAVAPSTNWVAFGPLVTPVGFRNPALLARMACPRFWPGWPAHSTHSPRAGSFWDSGPVGSGMSTWRMATNSLPSGSGSNNCS